MTPNQSRLAKHSNSQSGQTMQKESFTPPSRKSLETTQKSPTSYLGACGYGKWPRGYLILQRLPSELSSKLLPFIEERNTSMQIELGQTVKDIIIGFSGVVTGRAEYITGCIQLLIQPPSTENGNIVEPRWIDEDRAVLLPNPKVVLKVAAAGFDAPAPIK
jgi:hypothetical protein